MLLTFAFLALVHSYHLAPEKELQSGPYWCIFEANGQRSSYCPHLVVIIEWFDLLSFKVEIRRIYVQDGQQIQNTQVAIDGVDPYDSVTDAYCTSIKAAFGDEDDHAKKGGLKRMGEALDKGMVLALSLWDDHFAQMHWLDAVYPEDGTDPGDLRGPCDPNGGNPAEIEQQFPNAQVTFGKLKVGPIGSTF